MDWKQSERRNKPESWWRYGPDGKHSSILEELWRFLAREHCSGQLLVYCITLSGFLSQVWAGSNPSEWVLYLYPYFKPWTGHWVWSLPPPKLLTGLAKVPFVQVQVRTWVRDQTMAALATVVTIPKVHQYSRHNLMTAPYIRLVWSTVHQENSWLT